MTAPASPDRRSLTDSPWYWVYLFCTGALVALLVIGPKYAQRQSGIEQNRQKRQLAARLAADAGAGNSGELPASQSNEINQPNKINRPNKVSPSNQSSRPRIPLWPLAMLLGALLAAAWVKLIRDHRRQRGRASDEPRAAALTPREESP